MPPSRIDHLIDHLVDMVGDNLIPVRTVFYGPVNIAWRLFPPAWRGTGYGTFIAERGSETVKKGVQLGKKNKHKLDLRGLLIPLTLLKVTQTFRELEPGETLEILWSGSQAPEGLFKVLPAASYELLSMDAMGKASPYYRLRLEKKAVNKSA